MSDSPSEHQGEINTKETDLKEEEESTSRDLSPWDTSAYLQPRVEDEAGSSTTSEVPDPTIPPRELAVALSSAAHPKPTGDEEVDSSTVPWDTSAYLEPSVEDEPGSPTASQVPDPTIPPKEHAMVRSSPAHPKPNGDEKSASSTVPWDTSAYLEPRDEEEAASSTASEVQDPTIPPREHAVARSPSDHLKSTGDEGSASSTVPWDTSSYYEPCDELEVGSSPDSEEPDPAISPMQHLSPWSPPVPLVRIGVENPFFAPPSMADEEGGEQVAAFETDLPHRVASGGLNEIEEPVGKDDPNSSCHEDYRHGEGEGELTLDVQNQQAGIFGAGDAVDDEEAKDEALPLCEDPLAITSDHGDDHVAEDKFYPCEVYLSNGEVLSELIESMLTWVAHLLSPESQTEMGGVKMSRTFSNVPGITRESEPEIWGNYDLLAIGQGVGSVVYHKLKKDEKLNATGELVGSPLQDVSSYMVSH